jgi:hypothetical protein
MQPGNLVRVNRATIGIPSGTLALVTSLSPEITRTSTNIWNVQFVGPLARHPRRYLESDLEIISASR